MARGSPDAIKEVIPRLKQIQHHTEPLSELAMPAGASLPASVGGHGRGWWRHSPPPPPFACKD